MDNDPTQPDMTRYTATIVLPNDVPEDQRQQAHRTAQLSAQRSLEKLFESHTGLSASEYTAPHGSITMNDRFTITLGLKKAVPKHWTPKK